MSNYIRPDIAFQAMNLASTVSTTCSLTSNSAEEVCPVHITGAPDDWTVFATTPNPCKFTLQPGVNDQFCYHVPMGDTVVFES